MTTPPFDHKSTECNIIFRQLKIEIESDLAEFDVNRSSEWDVGAPLHENLLKSEIIQGLKDHE